MSKPSSSPGRYSFQKESYISRKLKDGEEPSQDYLDMFDKILEESKNKWSNPEAKENNLEYDLLTTDWILEKTRNNETYAQNLYAALCNTECQKLDTVPILKDQWWSCSWRYAGGIIADMRQQGDYIDWYCSGIRGDLSDVTNTTYDSNAYVSESTITDEIREDLRKLGWIIREYNDNA